MIAFKQVGKNYIDLLHFHARTDALSRRTYAGCEQLWEVAYSWEDTPDHVHAGFEQDLPTRNSLEMAAMWRQRDFVTAKHENYDRPIP